MKYDGIVYEDESFPLPVNPDRTSMIDTVERVRKALHEAVEKRICDTCFRGVTLYSVRIFRESGCRVSSFYRSCANGRSGKMPTVL